MKSKQLLRLDLNVLEDMETLLQLVPLIKTKDLNKENQYVSTITDKNGYYGKLAKAEKCVRIAKNFLNEAESDLKDSPCLLSAMIRTRKTELIESAEECLERYQSMVDWGAKELRRAEQAKARLEAEAQSAKMGASHQKSLFFRFQNFQLVKSLPGLKEETLEHKDNRKVKNHGSLKLTQKRKGLPFFSNYL